MYIQSTDKHTYIYLINSCIQTDIRFLFFVLIEKSNVEKQVIDFVTLFWLQKKGASEILFIQITFNS